MNLLTFSQDEIPSILTKLQAGNNTRSIIHLWENLQQRLVEGDEEQLTRLAQQDEAAGLQA
jgi:hypothetical protein